MAVASLNEPLVSVIIPFYNAEATIDRTLVSVRTQTYKALEIIVVDDGSTDTGPDIVRAHAAQDSRITLLTKPNSGVADARNLGIQHATGSYIAPVDADDLWAQDKTALQVEALERGGAETGLAYCWYVMIDEQDRIMLEKQCNAQGDVIEAMAFRNIVGNGSCAMMRREAVTRSGGYDASLRARGAEGCEDYTLYFEIAEHFRYAVVPRYLVGYRETQANMSSDIRKALRSRDLCVPDFLSRHPNLAPSFHAGHMRIMRFMLARSIRGRKWGDVRYLLNRMMRHDPLGLMVSIGQLSASLARRQLRRATTDRRVFSIGSLPAMSVPAPPRTTVASDA